MSHAYNSIVWMLRQEDQYFKASLSYIFTTIKKIKEKIFEVAFTVHVVKYMSLIVSSSPWDWHEGLVHVTKTVCHRVTTPVSVYFFIKVPEICKTGKQQCYRSSHFLITIRKTLNSFTMEYNILQHTKN